MPTLSTNGLESLGGRKQLVKLSATYGPLLGLLLLILKHHLMGRFSTISLAIFGASATLVG